MIQEKWAKNEREENRKWDSKWHWMSMLCRNPATALFRTVKNVNCVGIIVVVRFCSDVVKSNL